MVAPAMPEATPPKRPGPVPDRGPSDASAGWNVLGILLAGIAVWGGAGWLLDRLLGVTAFLPVGVLVGVAASIYLVYVRYGKHPS